MSFPRCFIILSLCILSTSKCSHFFCTRVCILYYNVYNKILNNTSWNIHDFHFNDIHATVYVYALDMHYVFCLKFHLSFVCFAYHIYLSSEYLTIASHGHQKCFVILWSFAGGNHCFPYLALKICQSLFESFSWYCHQLKIRPPWRKRTSSRNCLMYWLSAPSCSTLWQLEGTVLVPVPPHHNP